MNLNFFLGTAAELIKVYPTIHMALKRGHQVRVISSGQSRENFLMQYRDFKLPESALVTLVASEGDLESSGKALRWFLRAIFTSRKTFRSKLLPGENSWVIVHGDTLSTLAGAWLGWRSGLKVVHIEAGLRSPNLLNPFPEEITRRLVSRLVQFHMAPDEHAVKNLGRVSGKVICTLGNTLMDAVLLNAQMDQQAPRPAPFALVNIHRFENLNSTKRWAKIIETVVRASGQVNLIFITHPQTRHKLALDPLSLRDLTRPEIEILERMPFSQFIDLLKKSEFLISDGGSNQEECFYLGKACLLLRESSERQEGLDTCCLLSRFEPAKISRFLENPKRFERPRLQPQFSPSGLILDCLEASPDPAN